MKKFLQENWFKMGVLTVFTLVSVSVGIYYIIFLPNKLGYRISAKEEVEMREHCKSKAQKYFDNHKIIWGDGYFESHYNKKINTCIMKATSAIHDQHGIYLFDVIDEKQYGEYSELKGHTGKDGKFEPYICDVSGFKCKNEEEFNELIKNYMEN